MVGKHTFCANGKRLNKNRSFPVQLSSNLDANILPQEMTREDWTVWVTYFYRNIDLGARQDLINRPSKNATILFFVFVLFIQTFKETSPVKFNYKYDSSF